MLSLDPTADVTAVDHVWQLLAGGAPHLNWADFLKGLPRVRADAVAGRAMDLSQPNKWELISLLVDTRVGPEEAARLAAGLSPLELYGVGVIKKMQREMDRAALVRVLQKACAGELRRLSPAQIAAIRGHRRRVVALALAIGFFTNAASALWCVVPDCNSGHQLVLVGWSWCP